MSYFEAHENKGFNFSNFKRNKYILEEAGANPPKYKKTGTTIVGVVCKDGVVLATDTRATGGSTVMEKLTQKLHHMAPNIYCAGAGTAADCDKVTGEQILYLKYSRIFYLRIFCI
jgi:20S proteasome subunit beta 2